MKYDITAKSAGRSNQKHFQGKKKQKQRNGNIHHLPIATVNSSIHPLAAAKDLDDFFIRKAITSPKIRRPKQPKTNFWAKCKQKQQKDNINCRPNTTVQESMHPLAAAQSFAEEFNTAAVKSAKSPSAAATRNNYFPGKTRGKSSQTKPCLPSHGHFDSAIVISSRDGKWEMPHHPEKDD